MKRHHIALATALAVLALCVAGCGKRASRRAELPPSADRHRPAGDEPAPVGELASLGSQALAVPFSAPASPKAAEAQGGERAADIASDMLYHPRFATGFEILKAGRGSSILVIKNPWQGAVGVDMRIFLSENGEKPPAGFQGVAVSVPLRRVVCMSSSHIAFLEALGQGDIIKGVSGARFIHSENIAAGIAVGRIKDVGYDNSINFEMLAALQPDLVMVYGVAGQSDIATAKAAAMGIRTAYIGDYLETDPLGKAEWLVAFGQLTGQRAQAETQFAAICERYEKARALASAAAQRPKVMLNSPWRDVWFVPGGGSYMAALIRDAGGVYVCADAANTNDSRPLAAEAAYIYAKNSDFWLNPGSATTLSELLSENPRFASIPPVRSGRVWNNNLRLTAGGGSDFWESGAVMPDRILLDLIHILHPELLPDYQPYYYRQLK